MDRFLNKAKSKLQKILDDKDHKPAPSAQQPLHQQSWAIQPATSSDILRYRYHHGPNLGSIFVLERWMYWWMFPNGAPGESELSAVKAWIERIGREETKKKFEQHWANVLSDDDIKWLANEAGCTTIRLPIGYWNLEPSLINNTPFAPYADIYSGAWSSIRNLVNRLHAHSIGTLVDLHSLPGGANKEKHSGTDEGSAGLWPSESNRRLGVRCCEFLAQQVKGGLPVAGIQIVNETDWDSPNMYEWYDQCISAISSIDSSIPVIISDGWNLSKAVDYSLQKNTVNLSACPVVIDRHYYWAFDDADKAKTSQQITSEVPNTLGELNDKEGDVNARGAVQVLVGEYSCALNPESYNRSAQESGRSHDDLARDFGRAQTRQWGKRSGGSFFWTYLTDANMHAEWNFRHGVQLGAISSPHPKQNSSFDRIRNLVEMAESRKAELMHTAVGQHVSYWDNAAPQLKGEQWRYGKGYDVGYQDALKFFQGAERGSRDMGLAGGNRIGSVELWVLKRVRESALRGEFTWIFEQGLRRGIQDFNGVVDGGA